MCFSNFDTLRSAILYAPFVMKILADFKSLWMMFFWCKTCNALRTCLAIFQTSVSGKKLRVFLCFMMSFWLKTKLLQDRRFKHTKWSYRESMTFNQRKTLCIWWYVSKRSKRVAWLHSERFPFPFPLSYLFWPEVL